MFNTSFSYTVIPLILRTARKKFKTNALTFDNLMAFSHTILQYDSWAHDNEDSQECCEATNALGKAWKKLLKKSDAELGIDKGEFFFVIVPESLHVTTVLSVLDAIVLHCSFLLLFTEYTRPAILDLLAKVEELTSHLDEHKQWNL